MTKEFGLFEQQAAQLIILHPAMTGNRNQVRISRITPETKDAKTFVLETTDGSSIPYRSGQFLTFIFESRNGEQRRNYSISSSPFTGEPLSITIKRIPNGLYSRKMIDYAREGDLLTTIGANGFFTLPDNMDQYKQFFLFAAGSGISPVFSLLKTVLLRFPQIRITLIYSNHSVNDTIFYKALHELQAAFPKQLEIEWLFSNAPEYTKARLGNWLLGELLKKYRVAPIANCLFYLCGPFNYMRMITITLLSSGVHTSQVRKEEFVIMEPRVVLMPPDTAARHVSVILDKKQYRFISAWPNTILQAAKQEGIELPYSCEVGRCGACAAVCHRGEVWMRYNEVLTNDDTINGRVLTCTGYPIGGDVELDFDEVKQTLS